MRFFTLHLRLTRDCNAHCSYCSSAGMAAGRMTPEDFCTSIDFIADRLFPRLGVTRKTFLSIEYLGGEVLLIPQDELAASVDYARTRLRPLVSGMVDGAQSNLIGAERRILALHDLFSGRIGTSWDNHTDRRHIHGSPQLYRGILNRSLDTLQRERGHTPGRVVVIDRAMLPHVEDEVRAAIANRYDLTLRPVFEGGSIDVEPVSPAELADTLERAYMLWRDNPRIRIEPFDTLFRRRILRGRQEAAQHNAASFASCPFQSDCAFKSLSLDPDGTLFICQEMADSGNYPLGNAISGEFDEKTWRRLARRSLHLSEDCARCEWQTECGGGCMNEAIAFHGDPFAKTEFCPAWKRIFSAIESDITSGQAKAMEGQL